MARQILRLIVQRFQSKYFTIMIDEATDVSNSEQVVIVLRWVDEDLSVQEGFIGLYKTESTNAATLVSLIKDVLLRCNLSISMCRGQCYDGASVMTGVKSGVLTLITKEESRAVFTHCYGHSLNLAMNDIVKRSKLMKSALDVVMEISKLIKKSPKRDAIFQKLKDSISHDTPGFRVLCPTRWTVKASSLQSIIDHYQVLLGVWEESLESSLDSEMRSRIVGVETQMLKFDFLFGVFLGALLLGHSDNLSKSLQHKSMCVSEGQQLARLSLEVIKSFRTPENFQLFFAKVVSYQKKFEVEDPCLPRKRRAPARIEVGSSAGHFHTTVEDHYRAIYYEALDLAVECSSDRFDQRGYGVL